MPTETFRTKVAFGSPAADAPSPLVVPANIVGIEQDMTFGSIWTFRTRVGIRSDPSYLLGGRRDLLYSGGYRR